MVSYRSDGIPSESELKELICQYKTNVKIKKYGNYKYALSKNKKSEELLFIGEWECLRKNLEEYDLWIQKY